MGVGTSHRDINSTCDFAPRRHQIFHPALILLPINMICSSLCRNQDFPGGLVVNNLPANAGDMGSIPGSGVYPGVGNDNPLQCSCLENTMDRGAWQVGCSPCGHKESDTTKRLSTCHTQSSYQICYWILLQMCE